MKCLIFILALFLTSPSWSASPYPVEYSCPVREHAHFKALAEKFLAYRKFKEFANTRSEDHPFKNEAKREQHEKKIVLLKELTKSRESVDCPDLQAKLKKFDLIVSNEIAHD